MAILSAGQLQSVLRQAGWSESLIVIMAAIGLAESSGNTNALNPRGEHSVGLWQINMNAHGTRFGTEAQLHDPLTNARAALTLFNERQNAGRNGLTHWGAYTDGRYKKHLTASQLAYSGAGGSAELPPTATTSGGGIGTPVGGMSIGGGLFIAALAIFALSD